jgi:curved DNA-binding protein CbpA
MHSGRGVTEAFSGRARWRGHARGAAAVSDDPFAVLGLPTRPGLSDDDVRAAWRRVAATTHPDREDGGDPARFGAAAAAYAELRTGFGRGEVLADLGLSEPADQPRGHGHRRRRSADPAARAGRHRARREPPVGATAQLPGTAAAPGPVDAGQQPWPLAAPGSRQPWTFPAPGSRRLRSMGSAGQPGPPGRRIRRNRLRFEGMSSRWRMAGWSSGSRPMGSRMRRRPMRRPGGLALRVVGAAAVGVLAVVTLGWSPGVAGVLAGVLTWLLATAGRAFSRRRSQ